MNTLKRQLKYKHLTIDEKHELYDYVIDTFGNPFTKSRLAELTKEISDYYLNIVTSYPPRGWEKVCDLVLTSKPSEINILNRSSRISTSALLNLLVNEDESKIETCLGKCNILNTVFPDIYTPEDVILYCPHMCINPRLGEYYLSLRVDYVRELGVVTKRLKQLLLEYVTTYLDYWEVCIDFVQDQRIYGALHNRFLSHIDSWEELKTEHPDLYNTLVCISKDRLLEDGYELSDGNSDSYERSKMMNELLSSDLG